MSLKHKCPLVNNYDFLLSLSTWMNNLRHRNQQCFTDHTTTRQKIHKNCPELSVKSIKPKYESVAGVTREFLHWYFLMFSHQKCRTTFLEKEYEWLALTVKIFLKNIEKYRNLLEDRKGKFKNIVLRSLAEY